LSDLGFQVKNVPRILKKLAATQATMKNWKCLTKTLSNLVQIYDTCARQEDIAILVSMRNCVTHELHTMSDFISRIMDVEVSETRGKFTVKAGVDDELDEKRRLHNALPDLLLKIAEEEIEDLPGFMTQCVMVYVPLIGYLLGVQPWQDGMRQKDYTDYPGLEFMFCSSDMPHFKSKRCHELDVALGDTATSIADHETRIMVRLTKYILAHSEQVLAPTRYSALLDCLLAMATVAKENAWIRPKMIPSGGLIDIEGGRHPLQETCLATFVPNPTQFQDGRKLIVLTGPNACGKSIYLKQVMDYLGRK
jgi:DNA mismatch repair protein MSH5